MPPAVGLAIAGIAGAGASIYGGHKAASANKEASRLEAASTDKALAAQQEQQAYDRKQFADYQSRLQGMSGAPNFGAPLADQIAQRGAGQSSGQMLTFRAPTGQVMQRPASERYHWLSKGATVVE